MYSPCGGGGGGGGRGEAVMENDGEGVFSNNDTQKRKKFFCLFQNPVHIQIAKTVWFAT